MWLVLKISAGLEFQDETGKIMIVKPPDCAGIMTVYKTKKEAQDNSENGRYEVVNIGIPINLNGQP